MFCDTELPIIFGASICPLRRAPLFAERSDDELLGYGMPAEWLNDVKTATEDTLLVAADHLPAEAAEALLELATGGKPRVPRPIAPPATPFEHPDALRRFRVMANVQELERALDFPWEKWTVFLHPDQREMVERDYAGPARVSGSAGTGKTIVALHRAAHLARTHPNGRVLLTTFSDTLANALRTKLRRLLSNEPRLAERIDVYSLNAIGVRLYKALVGPATIADHRVVSDLVREGAKAAGGHKFGQHFLLTEWDQVVDAWQLADWDAYRDVVRLGRKTRLPEAQRKVPWLIFEHVRAGLQSRRLITYAELFTSLAAAISNIKKVTFDFAVVDEAQDVSVAHVRFLAALGDGRPNALFFAGDLGQRIFQQPFSWKAHGVDIRGRSRTLRVNYTRARKAALVSHPSSTTF
jgi:AAA domain